MAEDMGTTGTPGRFGADAVIDPEPGEPTGSAVGSTDPLGTGGELEDPALPFDRRPRPDDPVRRGAAS
jgi:hypothetical protein